MEAFKNLEVLWLNDNSLLAITNLDFNARIKSLYAHNNRIGTLKGSLTNFTFLHTLTLGNNLINNLEGSLAVLKQMHHLKYLDLTGNPLVEETGYRLLVIKTLPWLEILDMHKITDEERHAARRARIPQSWKARSLGRRDGRSSEDGVRLTLDLAEKETKTDSWEDGRRGGSTSVRLSSESSCHRRTAREMLNNELSRMRNVIKNRRILLRLKEWFKAEDPRRENVVNQALFIRCLEHYGLWSPGPAGDTNSVRSSNSCNSRGGCKDQRTAIPAASSSTTTPTTMSGETGLLAGILLEAFRVPDPPKRARALGRDPAYLRQTFIDYVAFCRAVEPMYGRKALYSQQQEEGEKKKEFHKKWKEKPFVCEMRGEAGPRPPQRSEEDGYDRNGGGSHKTPIMAKSRNAVDGLDHWERIELKRVFEAHGSRSCSGTAAASSLATPPPQMMITREQALLALKAMESRGRRPRIFNLEPPFDKDSFNQPSGRGDIGGGDSGDQDNKKASEGAKGRDTQATTSSSSSTAAGGVSNFDVLFDAAASSSNYSINDGGNGSGSDGKRVVADIAVLVRTLEKGDSGAGEVGPLEWGWLSRAEAGELSKRLYREASHAQRRLLIMMESGDDDAAMRQEEARTRDNIATLTRNAVRLETLAATDIDSETNKEAEGGRRILVLKGSEKCPISEKRPLPLETPPGRVDFFVATEFHGHPFETPEEHGFTTNTCDTGICSTVSSPRHGEGDGSIMIKGNIGNASVHRGERPRFSKTIMTAGG